MLHPSIDKLLNEVNPNRFKITLAAASRARDLDDGVQIPLVANKAKRKSISLALEELVEKKIIISE